MNYLCNSFSRQLEIICFSLVSAIMANINRVQEALSDEFVKIAVLDYFGPQQGTVPLVKTLGKFCLLIFHRCWWDQFCSMVTKYFRNTYGKKPYGLMKVHNRTSVTAKYNTYIVTNAKCSSQLSELSLDLTGVIPTTFNSNFISTCYWVSNLVGERTEFWKVARDQPCPSVTRDY